MIYPILEIKEIVSADEANSLLKENWVLLEVCNTQKGAMYVLGKKSPRKNITNT